MFEPELNLKRKIELMLDGIFQCLLKNEKRIEVDEDEDGDVTLESDSDY